MIMKSEEEEGWKEEKEEEEDKKIGRWCRSVQVTTANVFVFFWHSIDQKQLKLAIVLYFYYQQTSPTCIQLCAVNTPVNKFYDVPLFLQYKQTALYTHNSCIYN